MNKSRVAIALLLVAFCASGCGEAYSHFKSGPVGRALKSELRAAHAARIALPQLTRFAWDEVFLFGPYAPRASVCTALGVAAAQCESRGFPESADDAEMLLAFRSAGEVVHTELHYRQHGDFTPVPVAQPIPRSRANFRVVPEPHSSSRDVWLKLVLE